MSKFPTPYKWLPKNPDKYAGNLSDIWVRSSWEKKAMIFFDENPSVLKWSSEEMKIPYLSPVDNRLHTYYPDFVVMLKQRDGAMKKMIVEVKPAAQCVPPKRRHPKKMLTEVSTYLVNQAKWAAARQFCAANKMEFVVLTEHELFGTKK